WQIPALPTGADAGDVAGGDLPRAEVEVDGGLRELGLASDVVELDTEGAGHHVHGVAEYGGSVRHHRVQTGRVDRLGEAALELGLGRVVAGRVDRLEHGDLVDAI